MNIDAWSALGGAVVGFLGSLITLEYQRRSHAKQLKHERNLSDRQLSDQRELYRDSVKRDNSIREIELIDKELAKSRPITMDENQKNQYTQRIEKLNDRRRFLLKELNIDSVI